MDIVRQLREAIKADPRSLYRLALEAGISKAILTRFMKAERTMTLPTAGKLFDVLGLELTPRRKARR